MAARNPEELVRLFFETFNRGDLDAALDLYEQDAVLIGQPGQAARGREEVRRGLEAFLATKPELKLVKNEMIARDDLALSIVHWTLQGAGPDGSPVEMEGTTSDVLRRQPDGTWRFAIDNPFGAKILESAP